LRRGAIGRVVIRNYLVDAVLDNAEQVEPPTQAKPTTVQLLATTALGGNC
jgi:hypothetical protein